MFDFNEWLKNGQKLSDLDLPMLNDVLETCCRPNAIDLHNPDDKQMVKNLVKTIKEKL